VCANANLWGKSTANHIYIHTHTPKYIHPSIFIYIYLGVRKRDSLGANPGLVGNSITSYAPPHAAHYGTHELDELPVDARRLLATNDATRSVDRDVLKEQLTNITEREVLAGALVAQGWRSEPCLPVFMCMCICMYVHVCIYEFIYIHI